MAKKKRIDVSGGDGFSQDNPFGVLSADGLPQGEVIDDSGKGSAVEAGAKKKEALYMRRLKAGKGGKVVTEVSGFAGDPTALLKRLQGKLGVGGTCKESILELQGEGRERLRPLLEAEGYRVKG